MQGRNANFPYRSYLDLPRLIRLPRPSIAPLTYLPTAAFPARKYRQLGKHLAANSLRL